MDQKPTVLYIYPGSRSTFIDKDIRLLGVAFSVDEFRFNSENKILLPLIFIKQLLYLLWHLNSQKLYLIMFGGYWSLIPVVFGKIFRKKTIIINGGTDCVNFPSIGYGNFNNNLLGWFTKMSFLNAAHIITLHESLIEQDYRYAELTFNKQGLKVHIPNLKTPFSTVYNGYDSSFWKPVHSKVKNSFITVSVGLGEERRRKIKGIDLILQVAPLLPDLNFIIVGTNETEIKSPPSNVKLIQKKTIDELVSFYSTAQFYLQLSLSEGFPNSLCEAMLCECVPIVSDVASMPFIVGNSGFVLEKKNAELLKQLINKALNSDTECLGKMARQRIAENFTEEMRAEKLISTVKALI